VFATRHPVQVLDAAQAQVSVDDRGVLSGAPAQLVAGSAVLAIVAWAGPWAIDERWWSADALRAHRFQAVDSTGCAWLLALDDSGWWTEARYD
jgi:protein ImuB